MGINELINSPQLFVVYAITVLYTAPYILTLAVVV